MKTQIVQLLASYLANVQKPQWKFQNIVKLAYMSLQAGYLTALS